jgi:hypothetical protein
VFTTAGTFVFGCVPFVPSFVTGVTNAGFVHGNSSSDSDTNNNRPSWRVQLVIVAASSSNTSANVQAIWNAAIAQSQNGNPINAGISAPQFLVPMSAVYGTIGVTMGSTFTQPYRWVNGVIHNCDPLMAWGTTANTDEPTIKCQVWDATILTDAYPGDSTSSWDSHNWYAVTANNNGGNTQGTNAASPRGTLFLVVP